MTIVERSYTPRLSGIRLGLLAAGLFVVGTNAFVIAGVLPRIAADFSVPTAAVGYSITWYAIVVAVASPVVSTVLARVSRTRLMAAGMLLVAAGTAVTAVAPDLTVFTLGRVVAALGGAALVPAATAAAPAMLPADQRGRALAIAALGFTLATAVGSPIGTALAATGGWRLPLAALSVLGLVLSIAIAGIVRGVPTGPAVPLPQRFGLLRRGRVLLALVATLFVTAGFNVVYIFSAPVAGPATSGNGGLLAVLLLVYGAGGIVGTLLAGRYTDRLGSRTIAVVAIGVMLVVYLLLPAVRGSFPALAVAFGVWGVGAFAAGVPIQHRLVAIDPASAGLALSWYSTAMYIGIALAPLLGAVALSAGAQDVPLAGAGAVLLALLAFLLGFARPRGRLAV